MSIERGVQDQRAVDRIVTVCHIRIVRVVGVALRCTDLPRRHFRRTVAVEVEGQARVQVLRLPRSIGRVVRVTTIAGITVPVCHYLVCKDKDT